MEQAWYSILAINLIRGLVLKLSVNMVKCSQISSSIFTREAASGQLHCCKHLDPKTIMHANLGGQNLMH